MTRRRRRLLIPIIISSRASTSHIVFAPTMLHPESLRPSRTRVIVARLRFFPPPLRLLCPIKSSYYQLPFPLGSCSSALCISCTTRLVAYVLFVPIPRTLPRIFTLFITGVWISLSLRFFFFSFHSPVVFVTSVGNNAIPFPVGFCLSVVVLICIIHWGVSSGKLICVYNSIEYFHT